MITTHRKKRHSIPARILMLILPLFLGMFMVMQPAVIAQDQESLIINPDNYRYCSDLLAFNVENWDGQEIGQVEDLIIDPTAGFISYILVRVNIAGEGPTLYPIPSIAVKSENDTFYINISRRELVNTAPTWEDLHGSIEYGSLAMQQNIFRFWSKTAKVLPAAYMPKELAAKWYGVGMRTVPGSILKFRDIRNRKIIHDHPIGTIADIIAHPDTGNIFSAVLNYRNNEAGQSAGGEHYPIPLSTLTYNLDTTAIVYDNPIGLFEDAPELTNRSQAGELQLTNSSWRENVKEYWERTTISVELRSGMRIIPGITAKASELIGYAVVTPTGIETGRIKDIVVTGKGNTPYVMMGLHPQYAEDGRWYFIPFQALTLDRFNRRAVLGVKWRTIREMPGTEPGTLPDTSSPEWDERIRRAWERLLDRTLFEGVIEGAEEAGKSSGSRSGGGPAGESRSDGPLAYRVTELLGSPALIGAERDENGLEGELEDIIINVEEARIVFGAVSFDGLFDIGEDEVVPVPFEHIEPGKPAVSITVTAEDIREAEKINLDNWPELSRLRGYEDNK